MGHELNSSVSTNPGCSPSQSQFCLPVFRPNGRSWYGPNAQSLHAIHEQSFTKKNNKVNVLNIRTLSQGSLKSGDNHVSPQFEISMALKFTTVSWNFMWQVQYLVDWNWLPPNILSIDLTDSFKVPDLDFLTNPQIYIFVRSFVRSFVRACVPSLFHESIHLPKRLAT